MGGDDRIRRDASDEWEWVEHFLEGRVDGRTKVLPIELPADSLDEYGFEAATRLLTALSKTNVPGRPPWVCAPLARGARDVDALASVLASFASHVRGSWLESIVVLLAPSRIRDDRAWLAWVASFAGAIVRLSPTVRVLVLDDREQPRHELLARQYGRAVCSVTANLEIAMRTAAMLDAASDATTLEGQLRTLAVRVLQCVGQSRLDDAERFTIAIEHLAHEHHRSEAVVPARLCIGSGYTAAKRHNDAVRSFRAAELAAERAQAAGAMNGAFLRIQARFGVAAGLLAAPEGAALAARYYEETAPLCKALPDAKLEFESHRAAAVAHELVRAYQPAWDASIRALGVVDRLTPSERDDANLVSLTDAILRLTETRARTSLSHSRAATRSSTTTASASRAGTTETTRSRCTPGGLFRLKHAQKPRASKRSHDGTNRSLTCARFVPTLRPHSSAGSRRYRPTPPHQQTRLGSRLRESREQRATAFRRPLT